MVSVLASECVGRRFKGRHTVSVVVKVKKLVIPLSQNSERIFHEGTDNQEASNCRNVSAIRISSKQRSLPRSSPPLPCEASRQKSKTAQLTVLQDRRHCRAILRSLLFARGAAQADWGRLLHLLSRVHQIYLVSRDCSPLYPGSEPCSLLMQGRPATLWADRVVVALSENRIGVER